MNPQQAAKNFFRRLEQEPPWAPDPDCPQIEQRESGYRPGTRPLFLELLARLERGQSLDHWRVIELMDRTFDEPGEERESLASVLPQCRRWLTYHEGFFPC